MVAAIETELMVLEKSHLIHFLSINKNVQLWYFKFGHPGNAHILSICKLIIAIDFYSKEYDLSKIYNDFKIFKDYKNFDNQENPPTPLVQSIGIISIKTSKFQANFTYKLINTSNIDQIYDLCITYKFIYIIQCK